MAYHEEGGLAAFHVDKPGGQVVRRGGQASGYKRQPNQNGKRAPEVHGPNPTTVFRAKKEGCGRTKASRVTYSLVTMPFCTQCGHQAKKFGRLLRPLRCPSIRTRTTTPPRPTSTHARSSGGPFCLVLPTILCYVPAIGWIAAIIVLAARKFKDNHLIRFHAFQGLYLFAAWGFAGGGLGCGSDRTRRAGASVSRWT